VSGTVAIGRLALELSGLNEQEGKRLALLITHQLAAEKVGDVDHYSVGSVRVRADAKPGENIDRLSRQIVAEIVRQIGRSS